MRERVEDLVGPPARASWVMTFHAACGRILRREAQRLGYRSNFTIYDSADQLRLTKQCLEDLERDPKRFTPRGIHSQISNAKNQLIGPDDVREPRRELLRPDRRRRLQALPDEAVQLERRRLRRHALSHGRRARALPRGAGEVAEGVPLPARRRVPGHEPRAVPVPAAARPRSTRTSSRWAIRTSRSTRFRGADIRNVLEFEQRLPRREDDRARAELPLDELDPRGRERASSRTTASASRRTSGRSSATASRCASSRSRTSTPRRATSPPRSRGSSRRASTAARSPSSTGRTRRAACSRTCSSARASRTR